MVQGFLSHALLIDFRLNTLPFNPFECDDAKGHLLIEVILAIIQGFMYKIFCLLSSLVINIYQPSTAVFPFSYRLISFICFNIPLLFSLRVMLCSEAPILLFLSLLLSLVESGNLKTHPFTEAHYQQFKVLCSPLQLSSYYYHCYHLVESLNWKPQPFIDSSTTQHIGLLCALSCTCELTSCRDCHPFFSTC